MTIDSKEKQLRNLATKAFAILILGIGGLAHSGIPVIDVTNVLQTSTTAVESIAQTAKQIEQYQLQLQQYENMLKNSAAPASYVWDKAQQTMNGLRNTVDTYSYYKNQFGSIDGYLNKFQNTGYYRTSPCFQNVANGCTPAEWERLKQQQAYGSEAQKRANDAMIRGLDQQQDALQADARQLERLQQSAQSADGQMQAIQSASMIAANSSNQLLQIRGLLIAQQNAAAAAAQAKADQEAMRAAASEGARGGRYTPVSPEFGWYK